MQNTISKWLQADDVLIDRLWLLGLSTAAFTLFTIHLGDLPLRDWDEGTVAQVARNIWRAPSGSLEWLYPTLGGEPYLNKPPFVHWCIAIAYTLGGVNEWTSRLPSALFTAASVPLLYGVGREIFYRRLPALMAALVYLTMLPVARQGRLAMLDGTILCFLVLMIWCTLRSRRDHRYALGMGISLGLICMTKGVMMGGLLGAIAIAFLVWDTPRLFSSFYLWIGLTLGLVPVGLWYLAQWMHYGAQFWSSYVVHQSFSRIWTPVEDRGGPVWYYGLELLKYGFPWLFFWPIAFKRVWENRTLSWAKLTLIWSSLYFVAVSFMATKLPWYLMPLYPALALATGKQLAECWTQGKRPGSQLVVTVSYSHLWVGLFSALSLVSGLGCLYFAHISRPVEPDLAVIAATIALTMLVTAILVAQQNPQFVAILLWGTYLALVFLMVSEHWNWELAEAYPVKPVAQLVRQSTPAGQPLYTSFPYHRPSLDFYSDRPVIPASEAELRRYWRRNSQPYLLVDNDHPHLLELRSAHRLGTEAGLTLITKQSQ